ncbi:unnamed protein product [Closterium sp. NIES-64]|nr:unnamed protein product [Closterium sp. NIES-64]
MLAAGRIARISRPALCASGMLAAGRIARISRPALCAHRNARRWARSAHLAASAMRQAMRIPPLSRPAMRSADFSPLGALRLSRGQQCAQRIAHRWAHCASLAASNALSGLLTAGRIAPLSRPAMRSADCSPLGALRLSRGQQCAQRIAHRWAHCASLAASNAFSGSLTTGRIAPLSRPAMRSADRLPLGALRLSRGQQCAQRIAHRWAHCASLAASNALSGLLTAGRIAPLSPWQCAQRIAHRWAHCASLAASNALNGLLTAGRIVPLSRPAMRSADCSPLGALRLSLQCHSPCGILAVFAGFFAPQPFRFEPYDLLTTIVKPLTCPHPRPPLPLPSTRPHSNVPPNIIPSPATAPPVPPPPPAPPLRLPKPFSVYSLAPVTSHSSTSSSSLSILPSTSILTPFLTTSMHLGPLSLPLFLRTLSLTFPLTLPSLHLLILVSHTPLLFPVPQTLPLPLPLLFFTPRPLTPPLTSLLTPPLTSLLTPPLILVPTPPPPARPTLPSSHSPKTLPSNSPEATTQACPNPLPLFLPLPLCIFSPVPASLGGNLPFTPPNRAHTLHSWSALSSISRASLAASAMRLRNARSPSDAVFSPVLHPHPLAQRLAVLFMCILSHVRRGNPNVNRNLVESLYCN